MRAVKGEITSSRPISLSKAAAVLSRFAVSESGARPDVAAFLRRASSAFDELVASHREIRSLGKMSHLEKNKDENDSSRKKRKKRKGADYGAEEAGEILRFTAPMAEGNDVVEVKEKEDEKSRFATEAELNGLVERKKKKKDKKNLLKEESRKVEVKSEELERDGKGPGERRKKEKKRKEGREHEAAKGSLVVENTDKVRKKRKHLDTDQERVNGEMDQEDGKRKKEKGRLGPRLMGHKHLRGPHQLKDESVELLEPSTVLEPSVEAPLDELEFFGIRPF